MQPVTEAPKRASATRRLPSVIRFFQFFENLGVLVMLAIVVGVTSALDQNFFTGPNLTHLAITASVMAVAGLGMTFAIAMRGFDLSVGSTQLLTAGVAATFLGAIRLPAPEISLFGLVAIPSYVISIAGAIVGTLAVGLLVGLVNGLIISKLRVPAFVATLGMMSIVRGVALLYTKGQHIVIRQEEYAWLNNGKVAEIIPMPLVIALGTLVLLYLLLQHTPFGRHVCAVGGNEAAAIAAGLNVDRITLAVFGLVGVTAALSGVMLSSQLMIVEAGLGAGFELQVIAISVLGGTSLSGGAGNLPGTLFAALLLAAINSALNFLKVKDYYQYLAWGLLLILALGIDALRRMFISKAITGSGQ